MTQPELPAPQLITQPEQLLAFLETLHGEPLLAVDTESNSLYAYREQVCLIQFSLPQVDTLLDPLALPDLSLLAPIFASQAIEKVFHAAEYDLICLKRDYGFTFQNIFDTMVAARILGWERFGLGSILEEHFGVRMNKKFQRADWGARPLEREHLEYARLDTHFLIRLRDQMKASLIEKGLWELAREDFVRGCAVNGTAPAAKEDMCWRVNGARDLSRRELAVLQELCLYRDAAAARLDRPHFKVMGDRTLIAIATQAPASLDALRRVPGVAEWLLRKHGRGVVEAVRRGLQVEPPRPPQRTRPDQDYVARMEAMRSWRKRRAQAWGVESDVVLPRDLMEQIVEENPRDHASLGKVLASVPWRLDKYGVEILAELKELV